MGPFTTCGRARCRIECHSLSTVIALVTATAAAHLDTDLPLLTAALGDAGVDHRVVAWDDPDVNWAGFDLAVVRSTWDYHRRLDEFLAWVDTVASATMLANPPAMIRANVDKRYLVGLAADGVDVVPTVVLDTMAAVGVADLDGDIVVKPSVGAGANGARRFINDVAAARAHAVSLVATSGVVVQPYLSAVDTTGEVGLVFIGGQFSHAFNKAALLGGDTDWADELYAAEEITSQVARDEEIALAENVAARYPGALYLRVDLLPGPRGPLVSEVEAVEPSLFCHIDPMSARRFAHAVVEQIGA